MDQAEKQNILDQSRDWMKDELALAHKKNTLKLTSLSEFNINPFLWTYLAYYLEGNKNARSLAKALIYPRVLGTSITTSFGDGMQRLITRLFSGTYGSGISGIDFEFTDSLDGRKKYCQVKAGPNVINKDDVSTISDHFAGLKNLARTNNLEVRTTDMIFCLLYGEPSQKSSFIKELEKEYVVLIGQEFWYRFTGDADFYSDLVQATGEVANQVNMKETVEKVIDGLAEDIKIKYPDIVS